jgi:hypothetical protein
MPIPDPVAQDTLNKVVYYEAADITEEIKDYWLAQPGVYVVAKVNGQTQQKFDDELAARE